MNRGVPEDPYLRRLSGLAHGRILDVGFAERPNPHLRGEVIGFDIHPAPCPTNYARTVTGDMRSLSEHLSGHSFDTIILGHCIGLVDEIDSVFVQASGLLDSGGTLLVSWANPYEPIRAVLHWFGFYHEDVRWFVTPTPEDFLNHFRRCGLIGFRVHRGSGLVLPRLRVQLPCPTPFASLLIYEGHKP